MTNKLEKKKNVYLYQIRDHVGTQFNGTTYIDVSWLGRIQMAYVRL